MTRAKQSRGKCAYCGNETTKGAMGKHLASCKERQALLAPDTAKKGKAETLYHLRIEDAYNKAFWLDLEIRGSATLEDLDHYLREIWLECCGHLSEFTNGGWGNEIAMSKKADTVFGSGITQLTHYYDFGTTSETLVKVVGTRSGSPLTNMPIALMARNLMPECECIECKQAAHWLCQECLIEDEIWGTLCDKHVKTHPHEDYGEPIELVNSPRLGMCGYTGPAEPPY